MTRALKPCSVPGCQSRANYAGGRCEKHRGAASLAGGGGWEDESAVKAAAVPAEDTPGPGPVRLAQPASLGGSEATIRFLARMVANGLDEDDVLAGAIALVAGYTSRRTS